MLCEEIIAATENYSAPISTSVNDVLRIALNMRQAIDWIRQSPYYAYLSHEF